MKVVFHEALVQLSYGEVDPCAKKECIFQLTLSVTKEFWRFVERP